MMISADLITDPCVILIPDTAYIVNDIRAPDRMALHELKFILGKFSRLIEYGIRDRDFSDIMKRAGGYDDTHGILIKSGLGIFLHHPPGYYPGISLDTAYMVAALETPALNHRCKDIHDILFTLIKFSLLRLQKFKLLVHSHGL